MCGRAIWPKKQAGGGTEEHGCNITSMAAGITCATSADMLQVMGVTVDGGQKKPGGQRCAAAGVGQYQPAGQASASKALSGQEVQVSERVRWAWAQLWLHRASARFCRGGREHTNGVLEAHEESQPAREAGKQRMYAKPPPANHHHSPVLPPSLARPAHSWMEGSRTGGSTEPAGQSCPYPQAWQLKAGASLPPAPTPLGSAVAPPPGYRAVPGCMPAPAPSALSSLRTDLCAAATWSVHFCAHTNPAAHAPLVAFLTGEHGQPSSTRLVVRGSGQAVTSGGACPAAAGTAAATAASTRRAASPLRRLGCICAACLAAQEQEGALGRGRRVPQLR